MVWDINATNVDQKDKIDCNMGVISVISKIVLLLQHVWVFCKISMYGAL
jgi:hypothetical protein